MACKNIYYFRKTNRKMRCKIFRVTVTQWLVRQQAGRWAAFFENTEQGNTDGHGFVAPLLLSHFHVSPAAMIGIKAMVNF
jgi:hypothetical protein